MTSRRQIVRQNCRQCGRQTGGKSSAPNPIPDSIAPTSDLNATVGSAMRPRDSLQALVGEPPIRGVARNGGGLAGVL